MPAATTDGTGAAIGDFDGDGVLELLVSHGESAAQPLSLFRPLLGMVSRGLPTDDLALQTCLAWSATGVHSRLLWHAPHAVEHTHAST